MVNLFRDISQSHKRILEAATNAASTKFRSWSPLTQLMELQAKVQEALDLRVQIKWDQSAIPLMGILTRRTPLFTEVTKKYSESPPVDPEDSVVELDDLCTDIALMIERLDIDGESWDLSSGSAQTADRTEEDPVAEATRKIERLTAETNRLTKEVAKMSHGNNTPNTKGKPTTPKFHDGTCQVVRCGYKIKGYTKDRWWRLCTSCLLDLTTNQKTLTLKDKSEWLPSRSHCQAVSVLSHGEEKGLEPFIETLTEGQKAHINKQFENHHKTGRLKGSVAKVARVRFVGSNGRSESLDGEEDGSPPSDEDDGSVGEAESLFKALAAQRAAQRDVYIADSKSLKGQGKRAQASKGNSSNKRARTDPKGNSTTVKKGKRKNGQSS